MKVKKGQGWTMTVLKSGSLSATLVRCRGGFEDDKDNSAGIKAVWEGEKNKGKMITFTHADVPRSVGASALFLARV